MILMRKAVKIKCSSIDCYNLKGGRLSYSAIWLEISIVPSILKGEMYLYIINVVTIPERHEEAISKTQHQLQ